MLATFSEEQKAYLKALANVGGGGPHFSNDIERLAASTYGVNFNEKNLPKQVCTPCGTLDTSRLNGVLGRLAGGPNRSSSLLLRS